MSRLVAVAVDGLDRLAACVGWVRGRRGHDRRPRPIGCGRRRRFSATRWAVLPCRPRVIATYAAAAPVVSPIATWASVDGLALGAVDGGGVGELDEPGGVRRPGLPVPVHGRAGSRLPSCADAGDGPGLPVRDLQVGVVASGRDPVANARSGHRGGGDLPTRILSVWPWTWPGLNAWSVVADRGVEVGDLFAGVGDDQVAGGADLGRGRRFVRPRRRG